MYISASKTLWKSIYSHRYKREHYIDVKLIDSQNSITNYEKYT